MTMVRIVPREKWLYDDRGMVKWMGWLLSDHSAYLETAADAARRAPVKPQLTLATINERLQVAWQAVNVVEIQRNVLRNAHFEPLLRGLIVGFNAGQLYLQADDGQIQAIATTQIRWVALAPVEKWWDHDDAL